VSTRQIRSTRTGRVIVESRVDEWLATGPSSANAHLGLSARLELLPAVQPCSVDVHFERQEPSVCELGSTGCGSRLLGISGRRWFNPGDRCRSAKDYVDPDAPGLVATQGVSWWGGR
jgi:hypothetical protein